MKAHHTIVLFSLFLLSYTCACGQDGYYVDKDHRIKAYQESMIGFLVAKKQFTSNQTPFRIEDYQSKMYVRKELEIFSDSLLVVRFGSLGDHADKFWGVLGEKDKLLLIYDRESEIRLVEFLDKYSPLTKHSVLTLIKCAFQNEH